MPSSDAQPAEHASPSGDGRRSSLFLRLRSRIMAGLVLVVPVWFTYLVVTFVFRLMRDASLWLVEAMLISPLGKPLVSSWGLPPDHLDEHGLGALPLPIQWGIGLLSAVLTVAAIYLLGAVTTNVVGRQAVRLVEKLFEQVPLVSVIYHASKKVLETLVGHESKPFKRVVLVPFPTKGTHSVGFVTCVTHDERTGGILYTVFVATAPNPTTGFVFVVDPADVIEMPWSIEEAVKVIMSGGVLMPDRVPSLRHSTIPVGNPPGPPAETVQ